MFIFNNNIYKLLNYSIFMDKTIPNNFSSHGGR